MPTMWEYFITALSDVYFIDFLFILILMAASRCHRFEGRIKYVRKVDEPPAFVV